MTKAKKAAEPKQETSQEIIADFGTKIAALVDDRYYNFAAFSQADHDRILAAMTLGAVSAATGIMMEISDENFTRLVMEQAAKIIEQTLKMKEVRNGEPRN